ncbi:hypothetical protein Emed_000301 [Eimeria media]
MQPKDQRLLQRLWLLKVDLTMHLSGVQESAGYEGTKEEQTILNGGKYAVEAVIKVSPGGVFDGQAMCVVFDMAKASDVSGACDLCSLQLNTSSQSLPPTQQPQKHHQQQQQHKRNVSIFNRSKSEGSLATALMTIDLLSAAAAAVAAAAAAFDAAVGGAQRVDCSGKEVPRHPLAAPCPGALWPPLLTEGEGGGADTQEAELTRMVEREMLVSHPPGISLQDVVALTTAKEILTEVVLLPLQMPGIFKGLLQPPKGVLLFGPPGTGKTMLATALASVAEVSFFCCSAATLTSKWRGESEKLLRALFRVDDNLDFEHLARKTDGFSCADLRTLCREAAMQPVRRLLRGAPPDALVKGALKADDIKQPVTADDFEIALKITKPSVSKETALRYVKWNEVYGST